jgi:hypothetical protein
MVQREPGQGLGISAKDLRGSGRPAIGDFLGERGRRFVLQSFERFSLRHLGKMQGKLFLQKEPEEFGSSVGPVDSLDGQQSVGIHLFYTDRDFPGSGGDHAGKKEGREVVGDHETSLLREGAEKTFVRIGRGFKVRIVRDPECFQPLSIVSHAVDDKAVKAVAGPRIAEAKGFEHEKRLCKTIGPVHCLLKAEIPSCAAEGGHPVEDIVPLFIHRSFVAPAHSNLGHGTH